VEINWDKVFSEAHLFSWPTASLSVQNSKPPHESARNIFQMDKKKILQAAEKYGYKIISPDGSKVVSFLKP